MISVAQLTVDFGGHSLFKEVSFLVNPKDRIGLVGKNGAGKTTLLKVLAGLLVPTSGEVTKPKEFTIGYLPQHMKHADGFTVFEEVEKAFEELKNLEQAIEKINQDLTSRTDYESASYLDLIHDLTDKSDRLHILGGVNYISDIELTLKGLGFEREDFTRQTSEFSGGWRMRVELAKILLKKPNVFLLDEPTNHLDIESIQWLEDFLKDYNGAVVLISHDKAFLDHITTRTIEISLGKTYDYKAPYSKFLDLRADFLISQMAAFRNQQKMIEDTEKFIDKFRYQATKSVQVQSRIKMLDKVDRIEVDELDKSALRIKFPPAPRSGLVVVKGDKVSKSFGSLEVLKNVDFAIERGEKIAFVGRNGEGKTTMARMIMSEIAYTGALTLGHNVKIGYFAQNQADKLDETHTVLETVDKVAVGEIRLRIRDLLGAFMFSGEAVEKKVAVLSGGEKTRLAMVRLLLEPYNLLILDEPTNHLDIRSKDLLKQAIKDFEGTVIVVSHDREFLDGLVDKIFEFRNKTIKEHLIGIYEFLKLKKVESFREMESKKGQNSLETKANTIQIAQPTNSTVTSKLSYEDRKEFSKKLKKAEVALKECETRIGKIEKNIEIMDFELAEAGANVDVKLFDEYQKLKNSLEDEMNTWEELTLELEDLNNLKED